MNECPKLITDINESIITKYKNVCCHVHARFGTKIKDSLHVKQRLYQSETCI